MRIGINGLVMLTPKSTKIEFIQQSELSKLEKHLFRSNNGEKILKIK